MTSLNPENSVLFVLNSKGRANKFFSSELGVSEDKKTYMRFNDLILSMGNQTKELEKIASERIKIATIYVKTNLHNESNRFFNNVRFSEEYQFLQSQQIDSLKPSELYNDIFLACSSSDEMIDGLTSIFARYLVWYGQKNTFVIPKSKAEVKKGKIALVLINSINKICGEGPEGPVVDGFTFDEIKTFVTLPDSSESKTSVSASKTSDKEKYRTFILNELSEQINLLIVQAISYSKVTDEELLKMDTDFESHILADNTSGSSGAFFDSIDGRIAEGELKEKWEAKSFLGKATHYATLGRMGGGQRGGVVDGGVVSGPVTYALVCGALAATGYDQKNRYDVLRKALKSTQSLLQEFIDRIIGSLFGGHTDTDRFPRRSRLFDNFEFALGDEVEFPNVLNFLGGGDPIDEQRGTTFSEVPIETDLWTMDVMPSANEVPEVIVDLLKIQDERDISEEVNDDNNVKSVLADFEARIDQAIETNDRELALHSPTNETTRRIGIGMNSLKKLIEDRLNSLLKRAWDFAITPFKRIFTWVHDFLRATEADFRLNFVKQKNKFLKDLKMPELQKLGKGGIEGVKHWADQVLIFVGMGSKSSWALLKQQELEIEAKLFTNTLRRKYQRWGLISESMIRGLGMFANDWNRILLLQKDILVKLTSGTARADGMKKVLGIGVGSAIANSNPAGQVINVVYQIVDTTEAYNVGLLTAYIAHGVNGGLVLNINDGVMANINKFLDKAGANATVTTENTTKAQPPLSVPTQNITPGLGWSMSGPPHLLGGKKSRKKMPRNKYKKKTKTYKKGRRVKKKTKKKNKKKSTHKKK